jgi:hypothetical protein
MKSVLAPTGRRTLRMRDEHARGVKEALARNLWRAVEQEEIDTVPDVLRVKGLRRLVC